MKYSFIGWCRDEETNSDKVWGIIKLSGNAYRGSYVSFWGRRGKKLQTKIHKDQDDWTMFCMAEKKEEKGYQKINEHKLSTVYPDFEKDLQKTAVWSILRC